MAEIAWTESEVMEQQKGFKVISPHIQVNRKESYKPNAGHGKLEQIFLAVYVLSINKRSTFLNKNYHRKFSQPLSLLFLA